MDAGGFGKMNHADLFLEYIRMFKKITTPWKMSLHEDYTEKNNYVEGWNDCIKELNKNYKRFLKEFPETMKKMEKTK